MAAKGSPALGTSGRVAIHCGCPCTSLPSGVCGCVVAEAAPNGLLVVRRPHLSGGKQQKHESRFTFFDLMRQFLSVNGAAVPLGCGVAGCDREIAQMIPGGILLLRREHYGEEHVRQLGMFEVVRFLLIADEHGKTVEGRGRWS